MIDGSCKDKTLLAFPCSFAPNEIKKREKKRKIKNNTVAYGQKPTRDPHFYVRNRRCRWVKVLQTFCTDEKEKKQTQNKINKQMLSRKRRVELEVLPPPIIAYYVLVTITCHVIMRDFFFQSDLKAPSIDAQHIDIFL